MDFHKETSFADTQLTINNYLPRIGREHVTREILTGLNAPKKHISSMYFYDSVGSKLFEKITQLPEYYPTRTEKSIFRTVFPQLQLILKNIDIIELGSGDCSKISMLLAAIPPQQRETVRYLPVDVSQPAIEESAKQLLEKFPGINIHGIVADFMQQLQLIPQGKKRLFCFFGSTIGNLTEEQTTRFFSRLSTEMNSGDMLLLGLDMVKDVNILERAYNDSQQVTAAFNRNILNVVNDLVGTNFNPDNFEHLAFFNEEQSRIEMHLKTKANMTITSLQSPEKIYLAQGETIHTENSRKFSPANIHQLADTAGLTIQDTFTDSKNWFSLVKFIKK